MRLISRIFRKSIEREAGQIASGQVADAVHKIKAQLGYNQGNYYQGGTSGGAKWPFGLSASGSRRILNHYTLRRNARDAYHDTPQARAIVDRYADTVADIGLMLEAAPKAEILGISQEEAEFWAMDVEARFDSWARAKKQHRSGTMNWYQSHRLYQIFQHRDNDIFIRLFYSPDRDLLNPLQFEFIDPDQIRGDAFTSTFGVMSVDDGIIRDAQGREKAYKIWIQKKDSHEYQEIKIPVKGSKSGRLFMLHGFAPEYAGQGRGYSRLAHALQEFENITDFTTAQIKKAINQSNIAMYVKPSGDSPASNPFEGILTDRGAGPASTQFGVTAQPADEAQGVTPESLQPVTYSPLPEATLDTPGSVGVFNLTEGEDLKPFENKSPVESFDTFVDAFTSYLSAAQSMPLEVLLMKFNQNYSASRGALILFWRVAQIWREEMAADNLNPTYEMWLAGEIAAGRVMAPGWSDPVLKAAWINNRWIGAPMPSIDPSKTAKADKDYVEMGAQTLDRVARNLNGSSGTANRVKLRREFEELPAAPWGKSDDKEVEQKDEEDED